MKKIILLFVLASFGLASCEGPEGPPGPPGLDGLDGLDGDALVGTVYEFTRDFTVDNNYVATFDFPDPDSILDSDVILVYTWVGEENGADIWEPLPQTYYLAEGILLYGFNYTFERVEVFLDGTVDIPSLSSDFTTGIIFRAVILPADFAQNINTKSFNAVMNAMKISTQDIIAM